MDLAELWPPAGLRVTSGDLELRLPDDDQLLRLAELASRGVHAADAMPFVVPWTAGTPLEVARSVLTYHWRARADVAPARWNLELAVLVDGEPIGFQGISTSDYPVTRTAETGSWLGVEHQRRGYGTRMRLAVLHLLFEELGAQEATTSAFADNPASLGVTRRLGYEPAGDRRLARQGAVAVSRLFAMSRAAWEARPDELRHPVEVEGATALREMLEIR